MISLALVLIVLGIVDLAVGGVSATPGVHCGRGTRVVIVGMTSVIAAAVYFAFTGSVLATGALLVVLAVGVIAWVEARVATGQVQPRYGLATVAVALTVLAGALLIPVVAVASVPPWVSGYLDQLPWRQLRELDPGQILLALATILFLGPTGNGIVRTCLQMVRNSPVVEAEEQLKGGRFIGPLERYLILGLALAGQPTAAALIISAKSIIRFPELQSKAAAGSGGGGDSAAGSSVDELTEYFLLGSLLSWSLALLAAMPLL